MTIPASSRPTKTAVVVAWHAARGPTSSAGSRQRERIQGREIVSQLPSLTGQTGLAVGGVRGSAALRHRTNHEHY